MTKASEGLKKVCPLCHTQYPEEDKYCGDDGTRLESASASSARPNRNAVSAARVEPGRKDKD